MPKTKRRMMKRRTIPLLLGATLLLGMACASARKSSHDAALARNLNTFNALVKSLEENYVDTIRVDEAFEQAIAAMLSTVDPYTEYYSADEAEQLIRMTTGEYGGIGSYILVRDSMTYISGPYENSPAAEAGLRAGDKILFVDSTDVHSKFVPDVSKLLRGQPGTTVRVQVARPYVGADSILDFNIKRRKLQQPSVTYWGMVRDSIGYINLDQFIVKSPEEMEQGLKELLAHPEMKGLILDLRGNGGGLVESAVEILGLFLPKGTEVLSTQGSESRPVKTYKTRRDPIVPSDMPMAVLIDGGSASAAEITAGALQDLDRAVIVGSRSFGKGLVQSTLPLPFDGMLKVTVAKYLLPSGRLIQALDYSRRNPDGSVARTPDSLTNIFHTRAGREVRDGGGLKPDSTVEWPRPSALLYQLVTDQKIFDFANQYSATHPQITSPAEFTITDSIYAQFRRSINPASFKYTPSTDVLLKQLREAAKLEGYLQEEGGEELLTQADSLFAPDLERDLTLRRAEIERYLLPEILNRYYYEKGAAAGRLRNDEGVDAAAAILRSGDYRKILRQKP